MVSLTVTCWIAEAIEWVHLHAIAAYLSCKNRQHSGQQNYKKARIMLIALKIYCTCQVVGYKSVLKFHVLGKRKALASKFPRAQSNWASMGCAGPANSIHGGTTSQLAGHVQWSSKPNAKTRPNATSRLNTFKYVCAQALNTLSSPVSKAPSVLVSPPLGCLLFDKGLLWRTRRTCVRNTDALKCSVDIPWNS